MKNYAVAIAIAILFFPTASLAGPFGINQGDKISALQIINKRSSKTFTIKVPEPNSNFGTYGVVATPPQGVCAVFGQTQVFPTWAEAKEKRDSIAKLLSKYGKPVHVKTDRSYETLSVRPPVDAYDLEWRNVKAPLSTISLDVTGSSLGQIVRVTYFYRNIARCDNWEPKQDVRGL